MAIENGPTLQMTTVAQLKNIFVSTASSAVKWGGRSILRSLKKPLCFKNFLREPRVFLIIR